MTNRVLAMTGATGFVGGATVRQAVEAGWHVRALTRRPQEPREGVTWIAGALDDPESLAAMVSGAEVAMHIAGVVNVPTRAGFEAGNAIATANVVDAARGAGVRRFIHVSSLAARTACQSAWRCATFGVRKNGSLCVTIPLSTAIPMVCASASPATAAANVCRQLAPTCPRYRCTSFTTLNVNSDSGSTENIMSGGSMRVGATIIATDQASAAALKSRLNPSASQGSQPATK